MKLLFLLLLIPFLCYAGGFSGGNKSEISGATDNTAIGNVSDRFKIIDFPLEVARGNISGMVSYNKFGRNIEIDSGVVADIWDGGYTLASGGVSLKWVAPTQARTHVIDSDNGGDTSGGAGARTVRIYGLTSWTTSEVTEDITLNDASPPTTANAYVIIYRMHVLTKGATNVNIGNISATASGDGTVTALIRAGQGQTQMAIIGIPSTQTAYMGRLYTNTNKAVGAAGLLDMSLLVNPEPQTELLNFVTKHTFGLQTVGTSAFTIPYYVPKVIAGPAIIKIQITSGTNDMDVSGGFDLIIVDN
jgi:hypothetical protein